MMFGVHFSGVQLYYFVFITLHFREKYVVFKSATISRSIVLAEEVHTIMKFTVTSVTVSISYFCGLNYM